MEAQREGQRTDTPLPGRRGVGAQVEATSAPQPVSCDGDVDFDPNDLDRDTIPAPPPFACS
jgi:hypothetical protein